MLQVAYKGKFLHLASGSQIELEKSSPLFLIDTILMESSFPVTLTYDEHNASILGDVFFEYGIKQKQKIDVQIFDDSTFITVAKMVIDKSLTNAQNRMRGNVQGYFLTGASDFFQSIKNKKLKSLFFGGAQSFAFTTWDAFDSSNGFWQHVHSTWSGSLNYVMVPHRNEAWIDSELFDGWVNQLGYGYLDGAAQFAPGQVEPASWVVLWPKLQFVLEQFFIENGWRVDSDGIGEEDWKKLFLFNCNPIKTTRADDAGNITPLTNISISISDMISPEIYCSDFLLWICKRFGWAPIFEPDTKTCRIIALKQSGQGVVKDFTNYATGAADSDFSGDPKIFAFKNELPKNDTYLSAPDFTNFTRQPAVLSAAQLPAPTINYDTSLIFCFLENADFKIAVDDTTATRIWVKHTDNIYNEEPANYTDEINTGMSSMPTQRSLYRETIAGLKFYGYFPICSQPRNKEWGLRAIFYHGLVVEQKLDFSAGTMSYPYAAAVAQLPGGSSGVEWSNVYKHSNGTIEDGLIEYWWKEWLRFIQVPQVVEQDLQLPLYELAQLKWDDIINIRNQPFLIKKYIHPIPYYGMIKATLQPLLLNDVDAVITDPDAVVFYLSIGWENITYPSNPYWDDYQMADVVVRAYEDAAGTVPYNANGKIISVYAVATYGGTDTNQLPESFTLTGSGTVLKNWMKQGTEPGTSNQLLINYQLGASAEYVII
jgi:hypothetical protein